jgi:hypothetical protein
MVEKEAIAANACREWFGDAQRGTCRNSRIHRVTTAFENLECGRRRHGLAGGDHRPARHNHGSAWILIVTHNAIWKQRAQDAGFSCPAFSPRFLEGIA